MANALDAFAAAVKAKMAAGETVDMQTGAVQRDSHSQQRVIALVRKQGQLQFSSAPGRMPFSAPTGGTGTFLQQRFQREEYLECTLRAATEEALDDLLDEFANAVFEVAGPNAFDRVTEYGWFGDDSVSAGGWVRRNPSIKLFLKIRLRSFSQPGPYAAIDTVGATASWIETSGATGDGVHFVVP